MHDSDSKPEQRAAGHRSPIDALLTSSALFSRARIHWTGGVWGADQVLEALGAESVWKEYAGVRVATVIADPFLSGLTTLALIARGAVCVPLNPAWKAAEVREVLQDLEIQVVLVERAGCLRGVLEELPVRVLRIKLQEQDLCSELLYGAENLQRQHDEDCCLILLSSGTTGRPKPVPLRLQQLIDAATEIIESMQLGVSDACLNFLPMMHIGGFLDQFLVPLLSGGKVVFADPKIPERALQLAAQEQVTWIQGAPAMLNNLLRVEHSLPLPDLRFLRSVSAPLTADLLERLEVRFGVPVIEMYGMSETAGVITSNPLPPRARKLGSVGVPSGIELEIRNATPAQGQRANGEVWVRGPRLFRGYLVGCEDEDEGDWDGEWFRTGDLGSLDEDGYLFLCGRIGEQINRGGQKFSPLELDELCSSWPEVSDAAGFAFPHASLGQEVGLALVLASASLDKQTVQARIEALLAPYKVPRRVIFLEALPRNQNGKLQRHRLASMECARELSAASNNSEAPSKLQGRVLDLCKQNLDVDELGLDDDYFESGGDSLSATSLLAALERDLQVSMEAVDFFENATVRKLAALLEATKESARSASQETRELDLDPEVAKQIRRILQTWPGAPAFPGAYGILGPAPEEASEGRTHLFWGCNGQSEYRAVLPIHQFRVVAYRTLYELQARNLREIDRLCRVYAAEIERIQPLGPLVLGGFCDGAHLMERVAKILTEQGRELQLFIGHDYFPEFNLCGHHALIFSREWIPNPLRQMPRIAMGLARHYGGRFGLFDWHGGHNDYALQEFQERLQAFLVKQWLHSQEPSPQAASPIRPTVQMRMEQRPPRLLKTDRAHTLNVVVKNVGKRSLSPMDGLSLAARWENHQGKVRIQAPMTCALDQVLAPGQEWHAQLRIVSHKPFRLETLKIAFLEDGLDWSWLDYGPPGTLTCNLFAF